MDKETVIFIDESVTPEEFENEGEAGDEEEGEIGPEAGVAQDAGDFAAGDNSDPVAGLPELLKLRGNHDDRNPFFFVELLERIQNEGFGAYIDPPRGFGYEKEFGFQRKRLGKTDLLLIAAGKFFGLLQRAGAFDLKLIDVLLRHFADRFFISPLDQRAQIVLEEFILYLHGRKSDVPL